MMIATLSTGLRVMNFSSPHQFTFDDGTILEACPPEVSKSLMLDTEEVETPSPCGRFIDISLRFILSEAVKAALVAAQSTDVDIIVVPLPVLTASRDAGVCLDKLRVCRVVDRVTKTIHHDRFCV